MTRLLKLVVALALVSAVLMVDGSVATAAKPTPTVTSVTALNRGDGTVDLVAHIDRGSGRQRAVFNVYFLDSSHGLIDECGEIVSVLRPKGGGEWVATTNQTLAAGTAYVRTVVTLAIPGMHDKPPTILDVFDATLDVS